MPSFLTPYAVVHSGSAAPSGEQANFHVGPWQPAGGLIAPDPLGLDLLARLTSLPPDVLPNEVWFELTGGAGGTYVSAAIGDTFWTFTDLTGAVSIVDNGGLPCIDTRSLQVIGPDLVWTPVPAVRFSGGSLVLVTADAATAVGGRIAPISRFQRGGGAAPTTAIAAGFTDGALDAQRVALATQVYRAVTFRSGAAQAVQANAGQPGGPAYPPATVNQDAVLLDCVWSGVAPWGAVYVDASDVGVSTPERVRLPADVASNSAAAYLRYPGAFFRRPTFGRGVNLGLTSGDAITSPNGALTIYTTAVDLFASWWLLQLDGAAFRVWVRHAIAGLRRPADIWNQVFVPAMNRQDPLEIVGPAGVGFEGYLARLDFLEYARFEGLAVDSEGTNAYTPVAQTGGVEPPAPPPPP